MEGENSINLCFDWDIIPGQPPQPRCHYVANVAKIRSMMSGFAWCKQIPFHCPHSSSPLLILTCVFLGIATEDPIITALQVKEELQIDDETAFAINYLMLLARITSPYGLLNNMINVFASARGHPDSTVYVTGQCFETITKFPGVFFPQFYPESYDHAVGIYKGWSVAPSVVLCKLLVSLYSEVNETDFKADPQVVGVVDPVILASDPQGLTAGVMGQDDYPSSLPAGPKCTKPLVKRARSGSDESGDPFRYYSPMAAQLPLDPNVPKIGPRPSKRQRAEINGLMERNQGSDPKYNYALRENPPVSSSMYIIQPLLTPVTGRKEIL